MPVCWKILPGSGSRRLGIKRYGEIAVINAVGSFVDKYESSARGRKPDVTLLLVRRKACDQRRVTSHLAAHRDAAHPGQCLTVENYGRAIRRTSIPRSGCRRRRAPLALRAGAELRGAGVDVGAGSGRVSNRRPGLIARTGPRDRPSPFADSPACSGCPARPSWARRPGVS